MLVYRLKLILKLDLCMEEREVLVSKLFLHTIKLVIGQPVILEVRKSEESSVQVDNQSSFQKFVVATTTGIVVEETPR